MARTWEDGSYKFPFMDMKAYNAVCHADDLVMGGRSIDEAAGAAETIYGVDKESIKALLNDAYERHRTSVSGLKESADKAAKAAELAAGTAEKIEKNVRKTRKYRRLDGKEECIAYFYGLGAKISMLAEAFEVSETQMSSYLRDAGLKDERNKS